jgi:hypothetical protein
MAAAAVQGSNDGESAGTIEQADMAFMTQVLRSAGVIAGDDEVVAQEERDVGMTAGYFSAIKKVHCEYKHARNAPHSFVVKTWPSFEILPKEAIAAMFLKDIKGYAFADSGFYPRPKAYLAEFHPETRRGALVMEDADAFAEHKVHEQELTREETLAMIPRLVDVAVAWEGCDKGPKAERLAAFGIDFWASDANLALFKQVMPGGAKIFDKAMTLTGSSMVGTPWDLVLGGGDICEMFTRKIGAFYQPIRPGSDATCTLSHGDMRGDNIFFCKDRTRYPDGWLCIDFQLMFRGPVPSDLAYLMSSGSVLPEVYAGDGRKKLLRSFYDQFMGKTALYKSYTYDQFEREFALMTTVMFVYYVGMGAAYWQASALRNELAGRVELGGKGATEADLTLPELRQRMWWGKTFANMRENFRSFGHYQYLQSLPDNLEGLGPWVELPPHLQ